MAPPRQLRGRIMPMMPIRHRRHLGIEMCEQVLKEEPGHFAPPFGQVAYSVPPPFPTQAEREKLIEGEFIVIIDKFSISNYFQARRRAAEAEKCPERRRADTRLRSSCLVNLFCHYCCFFTHTLYTKHIF